MAKPTTRRPEIAELPDVAEVFADSVTHLYFDEGTFRIELAVTRLLAAPSKEPIRKRYTACRLVISATAVIELSHKLNQLLGRLEQQGVIKRQHAASPQVQ